MLNCGSQASLNYEGYTGIMPGEVALLYEISDILNSSGDRVFRNLLMKMSEHMGMNRGGITLIGKSPDDVLLKENINVDFVDELEDLKSIDSVLRRITISGRPVAVPDTEAGFELISAGDLQSVWSKENMAFFCVPIKREGRVAGVLSADRFFGSGLSIDQTLMLLSTIAGMIASSAVFDRMQRERTAGLSRNGLGRLNPSLNLLPTAERNGSHFMSNDIFISKAARSDWSFIVRGEDKSGRELVARETHYASDRRNSPFIYCDARKLAKCNGEIELFGRHRSAFLGGMKEKIGLLDRGQGGTLFIDEISALPADTQARLLKVLEEGRFFPVGGSEVRQADIRIIAGTERELAGPAESGQFNIGLFSALNTYTVSLSGAVEQVVNGPGKAAVSEAEERETALEKSGPDKHSSEPLSIASELEGEGIGLQESLDVLEKELIIRKLKATRGNVSRSAEELGLTQRILGLRLKKYDIDYRTFRKKAC